MKSAGSVIAAIADDGATACGTTFFGGDILLLVP
jgi:hypothetical protein